MVTVVLDVSGGVVQAVYSDHADVRVIKVDWDVGESPGDEVKAGDLVVDCVKAMPEETRAAVAAIPRMIVGSAATAKIPRTASAASAASPQRRYSRMLGDDVTIDPKFSRNARTVVFAGDCLELLATIPDETVSSSGSE